MIHPQRIMELRVALNTKVGLDPATVHKFQVLLDDLEKQPKEWRCFFCDEVFVTPKSAALHFGAHEGQEPICLILERNDRDLLKVLRMAEDHAAEMMHLLHAENMDMHQSYQKLHARLSMAATAAEQRGYEKGLHDHDDELRAIIVAMGGEIKVKNDIRSFAKTLLLEREGMMGRDGYEIYRVRMPDGLVASSDQNTTSTAPPPGA